MKSIIENKKYRRYRAMLKEYYDNKVSESYSSKPDDLFVPNKFYPVNTISSRTQLVNYASARRNNNEYVFINMRFTETTDFNFENESELILVFKNCSFQCTRFKVDNLRLKIEFNQQSQNEIIIEGKNIYFESKGAVENLSVWESTIKLYFNDSLVNKFQIFMSDVHIVSEHSKFKNFRLVDTKIRRLLVHLDSVQNFELFPSDIIASHVIQNDDCYSQHYEALKCVIEVYRQKYIHYQNIDREKWYYYYMLYKLLSNHYYTDRKKAVIAYYYDPDRLTKKTLRKRINIIKMAIQKSRFKRLNLIEYLSRYFINPHLIFCDILLLIFIYSILYSIIGLVSENGLIFSIQFMDLKNISICDFLQNLKLAIYFSFSTFSTVGYGDLRIREGFELIPVTQMMLGITFVGVFTGSIFKRYVD